MKNKEHIVVGVRMFGLSSDDLKNWLSLAVHASKEAGKFLQKTGSANLEIVEEGHHDIKLKRDRISEGKIVHRLRAGSDFPILTEESGMIAGRVDIDSGLRWIVDPLDGSVNYYKGIKISCVSIALWLRETPLLGLVYDFHHQELFTAIVGDGAWLNGESIKVSRVSKPEKAVLFTGFPVATDFSSQSLLGFINKIQQYKKVRLLGSAALSLAYVAAGRGDAYFEKDIKIWDVAAGMVLVLAAGGKLRCINTNTIIPNTVTLYASNRLLPEPAMN